MDRKKEREKDRKKGRKREREGKHYINLRRESTLKHMERKKEKLKIT